MKKKVNTIVEIAILSIEDEDKKAQEIEQIAKDTNSLKEKIEIRSAI